MRLQVLCGDGLRNTSIDVDEYLDTFETEKDQLGYSLTCRQPLTRFAVLSYSPKTPCQAV